MQNTQSTHIIILITQKELDLKGRKDKSPFIQIIHFLCIFLQKSGPNIWQIQIKALILQNVCSTLYYI